MKSIGVEGTVFWSVVSAILILAASVQTELLLVVSSVVFAVLYLVIAYVCWSGRKIGFLAAVVLGLFTGITTPLFGGVMEGLGAFEVMYQSGFVVIPQALLIFYALRGYREPKIA